jgi:hypothetical protein
MAGSISGVKQTDVLSVFVKKANEGASSVIDRTTGSVAQVTQRQGAEVLANVQGRLRALNRGEVAPPIPTAPGQGDEILREARAAGVLRAGSINPAGLGTRLDVTG